VEGGVGVKIKPGDLVKHADWEQSPINSYRDGVGFVASYDKRVNPDNLDVSDEVLKQWVTVQWLPYDPKTCSTIYHVDSLVRYDKCK